MKLLVLAALLASSTLAAAQTRRAGGASQEFFVEGSGGGYEVPVSPTFVTVFYLPEPVTKALASNKRDFRIDIVRDTVVVRPLKDSPGLTANLNIDTKKLKINIVLRVGAPDDAVSQVIFTRAEAKAQIDRKVAEALAPLKAALEEKERDVDARIRAAAQAEIAQGMLAEFELVHLSAITRSGDNVILRVPRALRMGGDVFLYFTIQNRGDVPFVLESAMLHQDGKDVPAARVAFTPASDGAIGKVESGQRGSGVLVIPAGQLRAGRPLGLRLRDAKRGRILAIDGLRPR
jgi:hypothetical protein